MNYRYSINRRAALLALPILLLSACKKEDETHKVQIRFTSENLTVDLGAMQGWEVQTGSGPFEVAASSAPDDGNTDSPSWTLKPGATVKVTLSFENVWAGGSTQPASNARLQGVLLVDGEVKGTAELNRATPIAANSYAQSSFSYTIK